MDKITSSAVDLMGKESIQRLLHITDTNNIDNLSLKFGYTSQGANEVCIYMIDNGLANKCK